MPSSRAETLMQTYEKRPNPVELAPNQDPNSDDKVDYEPHPEESITLEPERQRIVESICNLYSGSASEADMRVYAAEAVYDDPWSFCDDRYKIAGQWYGIPKIMALSRTHKTQILSSTQDSLIFKLQQEYKPKGSPAGKKVNSLVTLTLDEEGKVRYHKDMWNEKDYSHGGVGMLLKRWNGDYLTGVTRPPKELGPEE